MAEPKSKLMILSTFAADSKNRLSMPHLTQRIEWWKNTDKTLSHQPIGIEVFKFRTGQEN